MRCVKVVALVGMLLLAAQTTDEMTLQNAPPVVVGTEPRAGAADVPASTNEIRITFSRPMRNGGWSWVKLSDASFPKTTGEPRFLEDQRTCVLPVSLEPGKSYAIWLNKPPYENFQSQGGQKAVPYLLAFETRR